MSTSFQAFPPPIYPTTTTTTTTETRDDEHSSGSFVMVFVVLAIILVVSSIACVLGRFCTKKSNKTNKPHKQKNNHNHNHNHNHSHHNDHKNKHNSHDHKNKHSNNNHKHGGPPRPKDRDLEFGYRSKEGDIMLGFDQKVKIPSSKVANNNGDFRGMEQHGGNYVHDMHNFRGDHSFGSGRGVNHGGNFNMPRDYP